MPPFLAVYYSSRLVNAAKSVGQGFQDKNISGREETNWQQPLLPCVFDQYRIVNVVSACEIKSRSVRRISKVVNTAARKVG
jgi:hypothetical protein